MPNNLKYSIIVAGGSGQRMLSNTPKQFLLLGGKPLLFYSIEKFYSVGAAIILVLPKAQFSTWKKIINEYDFTIPHTLVEGGDTRGESVFNGLKSINQGIVAIHDGARPLVSLATISQSYITAQEHGNAVASVSMKDSIRELKKGSNFNIDRNSLIIVQTPQTFKVVEIKDSYNKCNYLKMTDDASVYEACGGKINLIEGDYSNIKITTPEDLIMAKSLLKKL